MQIRRRWPFLLLGLFVLGFLVYQISWVKIRVEWRLEGAVTYVRSHLNPVGALPPPQVASASQAGSLPTATPRPPTPTPEFTPTPLPAYIKLPSPAWEGQGPNNCGPDNLAMYLRFYGWDGDQYDISDQVKPVTGDRNVNVDELLYYAHNWVGWLDSIYRVGGTEKRIKQFLAAGIPVMVEKGNIIPVVYFPNDDFWNGHYALVTGYDDASGTFVFQDSNEGPDQTISYEKFNEFWQQFNRVYILIYLPNQEETVKGILGEDWDETTNRQNALDTAQDEALADPQNAFAWFNLGMNQVYFEDYGAAVTSFDQARTIGLPMRFLRYQFGPFFAYYNTNRLDDLNQLIDYALAITPNSEDVLIWRGWSLYKQGNLNGAIEQFRLAQKANPKSFYVDQALTSVGEIP